ncbi:MAG: fatty acid--CoA ligase family protein [Actinomycetota bacterium]|nr:fatty acid--CoA ligase family protein [Actinomycetota bacterium]
MNNAHSAPTRRTTGRLIALQLEGAGLAEAIAQTWAQGDAVLPLSPTLPDESLRPLLARLHPAALVSAGHRRELPDPEPVPGEVAAVMLTSGTTGAPKGVELTHAALRASAEMVSARLGVEPGDRWLACVPLHRIAGVAILARSAVIGAQPVVHSRFTVAGVAREGEANLVSVVPTMLVRLLDAGVDLARWRRVLVGGGALRPDLLERARAAGAQVVTTYGMTETCGGCVFDGRPLDGVEVAVGRAGDISIGGPVLMRAYRSDPELTAATLRDGRLRTADLGRWDGDGRLEILGRADDAIVTGGAKVWPAPVAKRLAEHPLVAEAAVVGEPDPEWGERVVALVVPVNFGSPPSLQELRTWVAARLERYNAPLAIEILASLPEAVPDEAGAPTEPNSGAGGQSHYPGSVSQLR